MEDRVNADFAERVVLDTAALPWVASPLAGVDRRLLDRVGGEVARATSVVRYAPGSSFSAHGHQKGEEFLVLEGVFTDEHGDFPAGTYVRNPPGSSHSPSSAGGCTIFVKLRQFADDDLEPVVVDTTSAAFAGGDEDGVGILALHAHGDERVSLLRFAAGATSSEREYPRGQELLVLEGTLHDGHGVHAAGAWIRNPPGARVSLHSDGGALVYMKTGHLPPAAD